MATVHETVKTINSTIRTALAAVVVGGVGYAGYSYYLPQQQLIAAQEKLEKAEGEIKGLKQEVDRLDTSLHLLKIDQRIAELRVLDQKTDPATGAVLTTIDFVETSPDGTPIGQPKRFEIPGDRVYVEYLVVKFNDSLVEQSDVERGTAICLFQRVFGNQQEADEGFQLDRPGTQPTAYARGGEASPFEEKFWGDFWDLAHDPAKLEALGVRAMQGNAPFFKVRAGQNYRLWLRTSGDHTMSPIEPAADDPSPADTDSAQPPHSAL